MVPDLRHFELVTGEQVWALLSAPAEELSDGDCCRNSGRLGKVRAEHCSYQRCWGFKQAFTMQNGLVFISHQGIYLTQAMGGSCSALQRVWISHSEDTRLCADSSWRFQDLFPRQWKEEECSKSVGCKTLPQKSWQNKNSVCLQMVEGAWSLRGQNLTLLEFWVILQYLFGFGP